MSLFMQTEQEVGDELSVCVLKLITEVSILPNFAARSESGNINFSNFHVIRLDHLIKSNVIIWIEAP